MSKPIIHAASSVKKWGGTVEDYEPIHAFMDSSKSAFASNVHRCLTHNAWFLVNILERVCFHNSCKMTADLRFPTITNSDGRIISVRDIGEQHILEDFAGKYIPTAQDYLQYLQWQPWMNNGASGRPDSCAQLKLNETETKTKTLSFEQVDAKCSD